MMFDYEEELNRLAHQIDVLDDDIADLEEELDDKLAAREKLSEKYDSLKAMSPEQYEEWLEGEGAYLRGIRRLKKYYGTMPKSIADMKWWEVPLYPQ